jgi:hypothetical protein
MNKSAKLLVAASAGCVIGIAFYLALSSADVARMKRLSPSTPEDRASAEAEAAFIPWASAGGGGVAFVVTCLVLWLPSMWRGALKQTNELSKAVQGRLD